jgi:hypothetical protein
MFKKFIKIQLILLGLMIYSSSFAQVMHFFNKSKTTCLYGEIENLNGGAKTNTGVMKPNTNVDLTVDQVKYSMSLSQYPMVNGNCVNDTEKLIGILAFNITIESNGYVVDENSKVCPKSTCKQFQMQIYSDSFPEFDLVDLNP